MVELYLQSSICLHGIVLNYISKFMDKYIYLLFILRENRFHIKKILSGNPTFEMLAPAQGTRGRPEYHNVRGGTVLHPPFFC
jgi:hypothetical protein